MADTDKDWETFMAATKEDPEEVETDDELEDENLEDDDADNDDNQNDSDKDEAKDSDKSKKTDSKKTNEAEKDEDTDDDDDSDDDESTEKKTDTYKPRLKQFLNKDGSLSAERIEKSYIENSKETVRVSDELKQLKVNHDQLMAAIAAKPEIAEQLFGKEGAKKLQETGGKPVNTKDRDPFIVHLEAQANNLSRKHYQDFVDAHPEAAADPEKAQKIGTFLKTFGAVYREEHEGEIPTMQEGLEAAYRFYGWDLETKKKEDVAIAARDTAATRSTSQSKKPASKKKATDMEGFFAKKLGVKL